MDMLSFFSFLKNSCRSNSGSTLIQMMVGGVVIMGLGAYMINSQQIQEKVRLAAANKQQKNVFIREIAEALTNHDSCLKSFEVFPAVSNNLEINELRGPTGSLLYGLGSELNNQVIRKMTLINYSNSGAGPRMNNAELKVLLENKVGNAGYGGKTIAYDIPLMIFTENDQVRMCMSDTSGALKNALISSCEELRGSFNASTGICDNIHGNNGWTYQSVRTFFCSATGQACAHPHRGKLCSGSDIRGISWGNWVVTGFTSGAQLNCACVPTTCPDPSQYCSGEDLGTDHCSTVCPVGTKYCPRDCDSAPISWNAGSVSCSATAPAGENDQTFTASDTTAPSTGDQPLICLDGTWTPQSGATCSGAPGCPAQTGKSWQAGGRTCQADLPAGAEGEEQLITDSTPAEKGSARFKCQSEAWVELSGSSCSVQTCPSGPREWEVAGKRCEATLPVSNAGEVIIRDEDGADKGQATYNCLNDGSWSGPTNTACSSVTCPAGNRQWGSDPVICQAALEETSSGGERTITDSTPSETGEAKFRCKEDRTWELVGTPVCTVSKCLAVNNKSWGSDPVCRQDLPERSHNQEVNVEDTISDAASPGKGVAGFQCVIDTWTLKPGSTCSLPGCDAAPGKSWSVNGNTCSADVSAGGMNDSRQVNDVEPTSVGAATFKCIEGSWQEQTALSSCGPRGCEAKDENWPGASGVTCSGRLEARAHDGTFTARDNTPESTGQADYKCNAGTWERTSGECSNAPQLACWQSGTNSEPCTINGSCTTINATQGASCTDSNGVLQTGKTVTCLSTPSLTDPACTTAVGNAGCPAVNNKTWSVDNVSCRGNLTQANHNETRNLIHEESSKYGTVTYTCNRGEWVPSNESCYQRCMINHPTQWGPSDPTRTGRCDSCQSGPQYFPLGSEDQADGAFSDSADGSGSTTMCGSLGSDGPVNSIRWRCDMVNGFPRPVEISNTCGQ